ncbi:hypothetical protein ALP93_200355 [Pseudomonas syringae pv. helianthi]|nr:hypothetical protein ALP93_200355 [Pseudomonas syringae pv. helianthi]
MFGRRCFPTDSGLFNEREGAFLWIDFFTHVIDHAKVTIFFFSVISFDFYDDVFSVFSGEAHV